MSVIPMNKVQLLIHRNDVDKALEITQAVGAVEFQAMTDIGEFETSFGAYENVSNTELNKITQAITFLNDFEIERGTWTNLIEGTTIDIKESDLVSSLPPESELTSILTSVSKVQSAILQNTERLRTLNENKAILSKWTNISVPLSALSTKYTTTYFLRKKDTNSKKTEDVGFAEKLEKALSTAGVLFYAEKVDENTLSLTIIETKDTVELVGKLVSSSGGEFVQLPSATSTPISEVENLTKEISLKEEERIELEKKASELANSKLKTLRIAHDIFAWQKERQEAVKVARASKRTVVVEGWCNEHELSSLQNQLKEAGVLCEVAKVTPKENEEPPVELRNNSAIQPFEIITRLYGLPMHKDLDPTPFLAGFFFLFFGLSLTDVGYGLFLMAVALLVVFYFKVSPTIKMFGKLLFLMGLGSTLVGLLFGGYLGIEASKLPSALQAIQVFDPIGNPLPVFYLALALGVVQVMFGMMLKIYSDARNNMLMTGVLDQGPWLFLFTALIVFGASTLGYFDFVASEDLLLLVYLALITVVVASGRSGKTIFGKMQMSLLSLYNSIGYFSDILSYSRLLALGLATSALAFAVNLIAEIVSDMIPYIGFILGIIILIVGHLFTLVVNTLGAFIHSARLQFVEFFGKFITGTGRNFKPLTRKESYISIVKDSG